MRKHGPARSETNVGDPLIESRDVKCDHLRNDQAACPMMMILLMPRNYAHLARWPKRPSDQRDSCDRGKIEIISAANDPRAVQWYYRGRLGTSDPQQAWIIVIQRLLHKLSLAFNFPGIVWRFWWFAWVLESSDKKIDSLIVPIRSK